MLAQAEAERIPAEETTRAVPDRRWRRGAVSCADRSAGGVLAGAAEDVAADVRRSVGQVEELGGQGRAGGPLPGHGCRPSRRSPRCCGSTLRCCSVGTSSPLRWPSGARASSGFGRRCRRTRWLLVARRAGEVLSADRLAREVRARVDDLPARPIPACGRAAAGAADRGAARPRRDPEAGRALLVEAYRITAALLVKLGEAEPGLAGRRPGDVRRRPVIRCWWPPQRCSSVRCCARRGGRGRRSR